MEAAGFMLLDARTVFGYEANSAVRIGLLGCGNRGTAVATSFAENTTARIVAVADLFGDQLASGKKHFDELNARLGQSPIDEKMIFKGSHAFEQLAASGDVDLIQISTPPFFHVHHLETAVAAGKHVYVEKPVGIDVRQAKQALEIAKRAKPNQSVDVGFQCRSAPPIVELAKRISAGALGKTVSVEGSYFAPASTEHPGSAGAPRNEYRLRNWLWDRALSGDILVEQNIHIIDLCNWMLGAKPVKATASGGRNVLTHFGDCWDNYQVLFTYPGDVRLSFSSTQFGNYSFFDAGLRMFGSDGTASCPYSGPIQIKGTRPWAWTDSGGTPEGSGQFAANGAFEYNLKYADREKERTFIDSITSGQPHNQIAAGVETALSCMLGRMAGLRRREVTWEELLAHGESYELGFEIEEFD